MKTEKEIIETDQLVGYCESCKKWTYFNKEDKHKGCDVCHKSFSTRIGCQITTQRTFNPSTKIKALKKAGI